MLSLIERPLSLRESVIAVALLFAAGAAYCLGYTLSQGLTESPLAPMGWTAANLLPWLIAFELAKRVASERGRSLPSWSALFLILGGAALLSLALEIALGFIPVPGSADALAFEALRRVPGAALVLFLLLLARGLRGRQSAPAAAVPLPLLAHQIDWIKAAGNYLEFHCAAGLVIRRMTIKQAEAALSEEGFVRIHRSLLVNGARIARLRAGKLTDEVELVDGTRLKVGGAYRAPVRERVRRPG